MDRFAYAHRRLVAVSLLVALLAVFGMGTSAHVVTPDQPSNGTVVLAVATPPAQGLANTPGAPDLPLADAEPPAPRDEAPAATTTDHTSAAQHAPPRAHRQPAADRAPPA